MKIFRNLVLNFNVFLWSIYCGHIYLNVMKIFWFGFSGVYHLLFHTFWYISIVSGLLVLLIHYIVCFQIRIYRRCDFFFKYPWSLQCVSAVPRMSIYFVLLFLSLLYEVPGLNNTSDVPCTYIHCFSALELLSFAFSSSRPFNTSGLVARTLVHARPFHTVGPGISVMLLIHFECTLGKIIRWFPLVCLIAVSHPVKSLCDIRLWVSFIKPAA